MKAEHVRAGKPDRPCDPVAVFAQAFIGRIPADGEIHLRAEDQVMEITRGHLETAHRVHKCGKYRVTQTAVADKRGIQHRAPLGQAPLLGGEICAPVGDIVHQTHEGIERSERIPLRLR